MSADTLRPHLHTRPSGQTGPLRVFRPTHVQLHPTPSTTSTPGLDDAHQWHSRASRKRRYAATPIRLSHHAAPDVAQAGTPDKLAHAEVAPRLRAPGRRRLKVHLAWDLTFWIAVLFTVGSIAWVVNGFYLLLPLLNPDKYPENDAAAAWSAFAGGTLFEGGAYLAYIEALNAGHESLFGPALWGLMPHGKEPLKDGKRAWKWVGVGDWREIGYTANAIQMFAATIFWLSTITGLPGVIPNFPADPPIAITNVFYWTPQVIGGCGFIAASALLMIDCQKRWWLPAPLSLGWHVGLWNLVGAVGFMLCGVLGYALLSSSGAAYQSTLSTFWGGWAFLLGSVVQLWESVWREPEPPADSAGRHGSKEV